MTEVEKRILNALINKYESSKTFVRKSKVNQSFKIKILKLFPEYEEEDNYDTANIINDAIEFLCARGLITKNTKNQYDVDYVVLNTEPEALEMSYKYLNRKKKNDINKEIKELLENYNNENEILSSYVSDQLYRIENNKKVKYFNGDLDRLSSILYCISEMHKLESETFEREFSVRLFNDSKYLNSIKSSVIGILNDYGHFYSKDSILSSFNLIKIPSYINIKGDAVIYLNGQTIDLSLLDGDIALSSSLIPSVDKVKLLCDNVITVENLTTYHRFNKKDFLIIYLGGFHNSVREKFIKNMYENNKLANFYHFGDIDVGGFKILENLRKGTEVNFKPYKMDLITLKKHEKYAKPLSSSDRISLDKINSHEFKDVVDYMLLNNIKLEQECVDL